VILSGNPYRGRMPDVPLPEDLSLREAYLAMFLFLETYWEIGKRTSDDIAGLLGGMNPYQDPDSPDEFATPDGAMWYDWLQAVRSATDRDADLSRFGVHH
jgi:hypothetical protein